MERLAFLFIAIIVALTAVRLNLTYVGFAILVGIALPVVSLVRDRDMSSTAPSGCVLVVIGLVLLVIAHLVCNRYGISFSALDHDRSFPKLVRRLPYYGIAAVSSGLTSIAISVFRQRQD